MSRKLKSRLIQAVLIIGIVILGTFIYRSIMRPEKFRIMALDRQEVVIERMKDIRTAQLAFKNTYGNFANDFDTLIDFLENGKIFIVQKIGNVPDSLTEAEAIRKGIVQRDTVLVDAFEEVFKDKPNLVANELQYIPYTENQKFAMASDIIERGRIKVPVFEVIAPKEAYLSGVEGGLKGFINKILYSGIEKEFIKQDKYKNMVMGSLTEPTTNGNWE
ncbi:MAG: hypothetical protein ACOXZK_00525 [Bacteroidales bacterium]|jgi:hypothetical protein|nr:hypothetical protein [Bacteroidales bacterium]